MCVDIKLSVSAHAVGCVAQFLPYSTRIMYESIPNQVDLTIKLTRVSV